MSCRYEDSTGRLRCRKCNGYVINGERCKKCRNRKRAAREAAKAEEKHQLHLAKKEEESRNIAAWRDGQINWYKNEVLSRKGAERIKFFERHPLANICAWDC